MAATTAVVGPARAGKVMTLGGFAQANVRPGCQYELEKGAILALEIPPIPHLLATQAIRDALIEYRSSHAAQFMIVTGGTEISLRIPDRQSERHPDVAIFLTPPPTRHAKPWGDWIPEIAVEVVSPGSEDRDYYIKRDEYFKAGLREYWIFDPLSRNATLLVRHGEVWQEMHFTSEALSARLCYLVSTCPWGAFSPVPRPRPFASATERGHQLSEG